MRKFFSGLDFLAMILLPLFAMGVPSLHDVPATWLSKNIKFCQSKSSFDALLYGYSRTNLPLVK